MNSPAETANKQALPRPRGELAPWPLSPETEAMIPELAQGQSWPRITLVTPSFNQGRYIEKTIRSVLMQGYPNLEYFVVDGGSKDESVEVIGRYASRIAWWVSERDNGQSHAINKGLDRSTGDLLGWLNSDDYLLPGALFKLAQAYLDDTSIGVVYGLGHVVDEEGAVIYTPAHRQVTRDSLFDWCFGNDFMQPSCLFTREAWRIAGPVDESLNFTLDVEYWMRISQQFSFRKLPEVLSISLSHPEAKTTAMRNRSHAELALVCMRFGNEEAARRILRAIFDRVEPHASGAKTCRSAAVRGVQQIWSRLVGRKT